MPRPFKSKIGVMRLGWEATECLSENELTSHNANPVYRVRCTECHGERTLRYRAFSIPCPCGQGPHAQKLRRASSRTASTADIISEPTDKEVYKTIVVHLAGGVHKWFRGFSVHSAFAKLDRDAIDLAIEVFELTPDNNCVKHELAPLKRGLVKPKPEVVKPGRILKSMRDRDSAVRKMDAIDQLGMSCMVLPPATSKVEPEHGTIPAAPISRPAGEAIEVITPKLWGDDYAPPV